MNDQNPMEHEDPVERESPVQQGIPGLRSTPPDVAPPTPWRFPEPAQQVLDNGMRVLVHHLPGQQVVSALLVLDDPLHGEPRDLEGIATITARCLDEGTTAHPGEQYAEVLETEGAAFGVMNGLSGLQLLLDVPASRLPAGMALFAEAIRSPELADADVARHRALRLDEIEQLRANSAQLASTLWRSELYGDEFRASRMNGGEPESVAQITPEAVRAFHAEHYSPDRATLIVAGDLTGLDAYALAQDCFGDWESSNRGAPEHPAPTYRGARRRIVDRPGAVQSDIRLGGPGIDRTDPRWPAFQVASYAMGGAFLSRLNKVLREEKGFTYGISLAASPMRNGGAFTVSGSFRTEVVAEALTEIERILDISDAPFTDTEVTEAISFLAGVAPLRYATADGVADQTALQLLGGLPTDWLTGYLDAVREVTPEQAAAAYTEIVGASDLTLVVVGDVAGMNLPD